MEGNQGIFIVIEGTDGSGKGTQFRLLADKLKAAGYDIEIFDFPRYDEPSSYFVREYLNGRYGSAAEVGPYAGSLFYALDRYDAAEKIREALAAGKVVLANRFTGSNMAHQGAKFDNPEERRGYFLWLDSLEFNVLQIPRPNLNIVLRVPADIAQKLVDQKGERSYTTSKRDIHEADLHHLERSVEVYDDLCRLFPKDFYRIDCIRNGELLPIEVIQTLIFEKVLPLLPPAHEVHQQEESKLNPYIRHTDAGYTITEAGQQYLKEAVTDASGNIYAFTDKFSPITIAAAMARLSRRGDDMRITILDEFANRLGKDEKLLQRVITAYGDDSIQQLAGIHVVVEKASNLAVKKLEWGRLAAYLEQSTRYIYFDEKGPDGHYKYYIPPEFDEKMRDEYITITDQIFDLYSGMVKDLTEYVRHHASTPEAERDSAWRNATKAQACDAIRAVLPLSYTGTVGIYASGQAIESLIMHLLSDELAEARDIGQQLLNEARKVIPVFLERADKPERGGATIAYRANTQATVKQLAKDLLPASHTSGSEPVTLVSYTIRNELDIVPDMLYEHSDLPLEQLQAEASKWNYDQKVAVFQAYMGERLNRRQRPGRALEKIHYSFDIVSDYGVFKALQRHRMVDDMNWQEVSPRLGYEVPKLVDQAGLTEQFEKCFELSLQLYSRIQAEHGHLLAQYAVLQGNNVRWKVTLNAREAFQMLELRTGPQGHPAYRKIAQQMYQKIAEIHPLLAEAMIFINKGEDTELTRLAAERYTQFKLDQLR